MTQEAKTPAQLRAEAEALEQAQWDREDPTWQRGVNTAYGAEYQRRLKRIAQTHGEDAARELNNRVNAGELPTWDAFDDAVDGLRGGAPASAYPAGTQTTVMRTSTEAAAMRIKDMNEADALFAVGKLPIEEYKEARRRFGVR